MYKDILSDGTAAIKMHLPLILFSIGYWMMGFLLIQIFKTNGRPMIYPTLFLLVYIIALSAFFFTPIYLIYICLIVRPARPILYIFNKFREKRIFIKIFHSAIAFGALLIFISATLEVKSIIPFARPFCFDPVFNHIDTIIHGTSPWIYLKTIIYSPSLIGIIDIFYTLWFFVFYAVILWQGLNIDDLVTRMQFIYSFVLCWVILGNALAILCSSAGPCYYENLIGTNEYDKLFSLLLKANNVFPIKALDVQKILWDNYAAGSPEPVKSISAMPSMHVSLAFLWFLLSFRYSFLLRVTMGLYFILILMGSVALGWHYAIDGYVAILGTGLIWWAIGHLLESKPKFLCFK